MSSIKRIVAFAFVGCLAVLGIGCGDSSEDTEAQVTITAVKGNNPTDDSKIDSQIIVED